MCNEQQGFLQTGFRHMKLKHVHVHHMVGHCVHAKLKILLLQYTCDRRCEVLLIGNCSTYEEPRIDKV